MKIKDLAGLIYPEFRFGKTSLEEGLTLVNLGVGGFCFYGGNAEEVYKTAAALKKAADKPLLIAADYEEGVGRRVKGATELPSNMSIGASGSEKLAKEKGLITGLQASALGIDWVFAPVLDMAVKAENPIVNLRSFGSNKNNVFLLADAYVQGLREGGVVSSLKHFPGHGRTEVDSHLAMPQINAGAEELFDTDIFPFMKMSDRADSVMVGHLLVKAFDEEYPASLSHKIINDLLRVKMNYKGLILTDALNMQALNQFGEAGVTALKAGADILLYPEDPFRLLKSLKIALDNKEITEEAVFLALERQKQLVKKLENNRKKLPLNAVNSFETFKKYAKKTPAHFEYNSRYAQRCITRISGICEIKNGDTVSYFEPCVDFERREGRCFTDALEKSGVKVIPFVKGTKTKVVIGAFSGPQAYSGKINLSEQQTKEIKSILAESYKPFVISFGSPFIFRDFDVKVINAFCAYGKLPEFQKCMADILIGKAKAKGKLPVSI